MHELVKEASRALSTHDAETLERLAAEVRTRGNCLGGNLAELVRATEVLAAQVHAASRYLALESRFTNVLPLTWKEDRWVR